MTANPTPEIGQIVEVRQRHFVVMDIKGTALPMDPLQPLSAPNQTLVTLSSIEEDALGEELQVVWELEPGARPHEKISLPDPTGFDDPVRFDAFLDAVRWGSISSADLRALQAPFRSGIDIEDYQLAPVVRAIQMPRVNLLIADDVGLGKTIEAGLVAQELILRHRARRILIVCPSALQIQWRDQMHQKFGLAFRIVDSDLMKLLRRRRGIHVNPWTHFPRLITSIDFLKRDRPLRLFREVLPAEGEPRYPRRLDLLILDEAHNVAPSGRGNYATDSQRTQAIRLIEPHFEHKLFLTATPHNGYTESFTALLALLDNQRFACGVPVDKAQLHKSVMIRRLKSELEARWDGSPRFPKRKIVAIEVPYTDAERRAHRALREYTELRQAKSDDATERFATEFVLKLLKKRMFSSPAAFATTLAQHEKSIATARKRGAVLRPSIGILKRQVSNMEEEFADDNHYEESQAEVVDVSTRLFRDLTADESRLLRELREWAVKATALPDSKARQLVAWIKKHLKPDGKWNDNRVIIFTEYRATQKWLQQLLVSHDLGDAQHLMMLYGGMDHDEREKIKAAFQTDTQISPVRILLATDAASEGIDLQNHCSRLIHYEIPWNPNRLEQRNGRVDRHGQKADRVLIHHFVGEGFEKRQGGNELKPGDLEGDLEFLAIAVRKVESIREDVGKVGPVIADQVESAMLGRRQILDTSDAEKKAGPIRDLLKAERKLREQVLEHYEQLNETKRNLDLSPENVLTAVQIGLELAGYPRLIEAKLPGVWPDPKGRRKECPVFHLPQLGGSWAMCSEGLEHPHTKVIRPIVFDNDLASGRDDVVLAHLNHRLVQMCLGLLRAEVWSREDRKSLNRVTARVVPNHALDTPAVVVYGRLLVLGADHQRLHEELITAGGIIKEGRFARMTEKDLRAALTVATSDEPSGAVKERLRDVWPNLKAPLFKALEARMTDLSASLEKKLADRARKESEDIEKILLELKAGIEKEIAVQDRPQLSLFTDEETEQFERNRATLVERIRRIPQEIEDEKALISKRYAGPTSRVFPAAVAWLVPHKLAEVKGGR